MEIERKYLLRALPERLRNGEEIRQGYLSVGDPEVRVRQKGERFFVTKKQGAGLVREEIEEEVTEQVFNILWPATEGKRVEKTRYELPDAEGLVWELDEYSGDLAGLLTVEVELPSAETTPQVPDILKNLVVIDITDDSRYKNKNLAIQGLPSPELDGG